MGAPGRDKRLPTQREKSRGGAVSGAVKNCRVCRARNTGGRTAVTPKSRCPAEDDAMQAGPGHTNGQALSVPAAPAQSGAVHCCTSASCESAAATFASCACATPLANSPSSSRAKTRRSIVITPDPYGRRFRKDRARLPEFGRFTSPFSREPAILPAVTGGAGLSPGRAWLSPGTSSSRHRPKPRGARCLSGSAASAARLAARRSGAPPPAHPAADPSIAAREAA